MVVAKGEWDFSGNPKLRILSLGAGVQSSTMALMAEEGAFDHKPDYAIFADTGWEPRKVYDHLAWLKSQLSFPVIVCKNHLKSGSIKQDMINELLEGSKHFSPTINQFIKNGKAAWTGG